MDLIKVNKFYLLIAIISTFVATCLKSFSTGNTLLIQSLLIGLLIIYMYEKTPKDVDFKKDILHLNKVSNKTILKSLISVVGVFPLIILVNVLGLYIIVLQHKTSSMINASPLTPGNPTSIGVLLITVGIVPAIIEELIFRGIILTSLQKYGNRFATIYSSILYCFIHCNPITLLTDFLLGCMYSRITIKSKSTIPAIIAHMVCNCLAIIMMYSKFQSFSKLICIVLLSVWMAYYIVRFGIYLFKKYSIKAKTKSVSIVEKNCKQIEKLIEKTSITKKDIYSMVVLILPMSCIGYVIILLKII